MTTSVVIERLSPKHDRTRFSCGVPALDRYLREHAGQDERRHVAHCFVAVTDGPSVIAGYYTLTASVIPFALLPASQQRRLPRYPQLPAALIGRLAVDLSRQGKGLGAAMIIDAGRRALLSDPAFYALVVEAKDAVAAAFYRRHQFEPFGEAPLTLFQPLATFQRLFPP